MLKLVEKKNSWNDLLPPTRFLQFFLKMMFFFMKIEWNKRSADGGMFGNSLCAQNDTESVLFCLILLVLCCTEGLYERKLLECAV